MEKKKEAAACFNPEEMTPQEALKFEIASELGLADKVMENGWRSLTAKESGRIGGRCKRQKRTGIRTNPGIENPVRIFYNRTRKKCRWDGRKGKDNGER